MHPYRVNCHGYLPAGLFLCIKEIRLESLSEEENNSFKLYLKHIKYSNLALEAIYFKRLVLQFFASVTL